VVGVQVAQDHRVDAEKRRVPLQRPQSPVSQIDDQAEAVRLEQVAGRGTVGPWEAS
jgi:hypothetical protein